MLQDVWRQARLRLFGVPQPLLFLHQLEFIINQ